MDVKQDEYYNIKKISNFNIPSTADSKLIQKENDGKASNSNPSNSNS